MWPVTQTSSDGVWADGTAPDLKSPKKKFAAKKEIALASGAERLRQLSGESTSTTKKSRKRGKRRMPSFLKSSYEIDTTPFASDSAAEDITTTSSTTPSTPSIPNNTEVLLETNKEETKTLKTTSFSSSYRKKTNTLRARTSPSKLLQSSVSLTEKLEKKTSRCTPAFLRNLESCTRTIVVVLFAVGFGLDLVHKISSTSNHLSTGSANDHVNEADHVYSLEEEDSTDEAHFGAGRRASDATEIAAKYLLVSAVNEMSTNYAVSAVFLVCCVVTLVFAALRLYLFPFGLSSENKTSAPEAQLFSTLTTRSTGWMEMAWNILTSLRAIFDDVCVFSTALVLTLSISGIEMYR